MRFHSTQKTLEQAIKRAARCQLPTDKASPRYKRHPHQRRPWFTESLLNEACERLLGVQHQLAASTDFHALYSLVRETIGVMRGIGKDGLTVYDVAHRIGAYLSLEPGHVYLHAGTLEGARALGLSGKVLNKSQLPAAFRKLTDAEIEDCLCIYKDDLHRLARRL